MTQIAPLLLMQKFDPVSNPTNQNRKNSTHAFGVSHIEQESPYCIKIRFKKFKLEEARTLSPALKSLAVGLALGLLGYGKLGDDNWAMENWATM